MEIKTLISKGAIECAPKATGFHARVFLVPKKNGKLRLVFNMKPLSRFIAAKSFKMATLKMVARLLRLGDFVVSLDLSDTYFHVCIHPASHCFLRFQFTGKFFQFRAMPFGLSSAPCMFTKLTCPITLFCWRFGIRVIFYLDDSIIMAHSRQSLLQHHDLVLTLLK